MSRRGWILVIAAAALVALVYVLALTGVIVEQR